MKVLLLLSLLVLVCYSHTKLRTNSPNDQPQLDLQLSETDNQINLLGQTQNLDVNAVINTDPIQTALLNGLAQVLRAVKARGDLKNDVNFPSRPVVLSIQSQTRNNAIVGYTFQVNQDDGSGNTLRSVFTVAPGNGATVSYYNYYAQNVGTSQTRPKPLESVPLSEVSTNPDVQAAYDLGLGNVKNIALAKGDIDGTRFEKDTLVSIQLQRTGNETAYLFNVNSNTGLNVILYSSFTVIKRGNVQVFLDFAYNAQKNQFGSALPQSVELLAPGAVLDSDVSSAYNVGIDALEKIAKADGDLKDNDSFGPKLVTSIHKQQIGGARRDYSYTFQANVNSTQGVVFAVTFVVVSTGGVKSLAGYAYNELQLARYQVIPEGLLVGDPTRVNDDLLNFGIRALIEVAIDLKHILSNYTVSSKSVSQYWTQHNNASDDTHVFVFNTTDSSTQTVIAASISVVVRGAQRILSGYAYNILAANSTTVISSSLETLNYTALQDNVNVSQSLEVGLQGLRDAAIEKGDLGQGARFVNVIVNKTLQKSTIGFDYTYLFRVEVETGTGIAFGAVLSVTWRAVESKRYLAAYAYNLQNSTLKQVLPLDLINLNVQLFTNDAVIRSYVFEGIKNVIKIAISRGEVPADFNYTGEPSVTSIQRQSVFNDLNFLFQVSFSGPVNITFAAGFTIVIRTIAPTIPILSTYAYTVQTTKLTQVLAQPAVEVTPFNAATLNIPSIRDAVAYGLEQLFNIAVNKGDLKTADTFDQSSRSILKILNQTTGNDFAYIFNVSINTTTSIRVSASLSVTIRATSNRPVLSGYAYIVQNNSLKGVSPSALEDQSLAAVATAGTPKTLLDAGVAELIRLAKSANHLANGFPAAPTVETTRVRSSATGNDVTYVFDFNVEDATTKIRLAAIISVTLRAVNSEKVLNYFAYSLLFVNTSSLIPTDFAPADLEEANRAPGKDLLAYGVGQVVEILKRASLVSNQLDGAKTQAISVQKQSVDGDTSYAFQVLVNNQKGLILGVAFTVTARTVPANENILVNYAYNLQNTTGKSVGTKYSQYLNSADVSGPAVKEFLDVGAKFIKDTAVANRHIRSSVSFNSVTPISAQKLEIGSDTIGYQFQASLNDGNGVTVSATFTVLQIGTSNKVVSNYAYNVQTVTRNVGSSAL